MTLSDASLSDLVAELRERLRHFSTRPPGEESPDNTPGPLGPAGRAALAARLLAVALGARQGREASLTARAFEDLAAALAVAPAPLPGSAWEGDLAELASALEAIAGAWDRGDDSELAAGWRAVRAVGDRLWARPTVAAADPGAPRETDAAAARDTAAAASPVMQTCQTAEPDASDRVGVWLLVNGALRRASLRKRLVAAGLAVDCPERIVEVIARLTDERPLAIICDDAAPGRFHSRLRSRLSDDAPPVVLVRSRTLAVNPDGPVWLPPYDVAALLDRLSP